MELTPHQSATSSTGSCSSPRACQMQVAQELCWRVSFRFDDREGVLPGVPAMMMSDTISAHASI
jgi:hypothetical protein